MQEPHTINISLGFGRPFTLFLPGDIPDDEVVATCDELKRALAAIDAELPRMGLAPEQLVAEFERRLRRAFDHFTGRVKLLAMRAPAGPSH
jgi:hypothetical protein